MALTIIQHEKDLQEYLKGRYLITSNDAEFDYSWNPDWAQDPFIQEILSEIDHVTTEDGRVFYNKDFDEKHSKEGLSTGTKTLILIYKFPDVVFQSRFGNNCTPFIERIAEQHDITLFSRFTHMYPFEYIDQINFINWDIVVEDSEELYSFYVELRDKFAEWRKRNSLN